tara:strand:+ start:691 stop:1053 length:363 start_codon:yes stop_codon:yes gene_type:complete
MENIKITDEMLNAFLGDSTNAQARTNLRHECEQDKDVHGDVVEYWEMINDVQDHVKKFPSNWIDASFGNVQVYHTKDLAIYVNGNGYEVHNMNITKSKFSLLLNADNLDAVINFVEKRVA